MITPHLPPAHGNLSQRAERYLNRVPGRLFEAISALVCARPRQRAALMRARRPSPIVIGLSPITPSPTHRRIPWRAAADRIRVPGGVLSATTVRARTRRLLLVAQQRELDPKDAALMLAPLDGELRAMCARDPLGDRETQTGPVDLPREGSARTNRSKMRGNSASEIPMRLSRTGARVD